MRSAIGAVVGHAGYLWNCGRGRFLIQILGDIADSIHRLHKFGVLGHLM